MSLAYKPAIFAKGLILVVVSGIVGSCFLVLQNQLWIAAGRLSLDERRDTEIVSTLNQLIHNLWSVAGDLITLAYQGRDDVWREGLSKHQGLLRKQCDQLVTMAKGRHEQEAFAGTLAETCSNLCDDLINLQSENGHKEKSPNRVNIKQVAAILKNVTLGANKAQALIERQITRLHATRQEQDNLLAWQRLAIVGGLVGNFVTALLLAIIFSKNISARLARLLLTANRLSDFSDANERLSGNDELAYLDWSLAQAARELELSQELRKSVREMVTENMSLPLLAAQASVEQVSMSCTAQMPDLVLRYFNPIQSSLNKVLRLVTELSLPEQRQEAKTISENTKTDVPVTRENDLPAGKCGWLSGLFSPRVGRKIILIVLVPFVLETGYLGWLQQQMQATEDIAMQERRLNDVIWHIDSIILGVMRSSYGLMMCANGGKQVFRDIATDSITRMLAELDELKEIAGNDPAITGLVAQLKARTTEQVELLHSDFPQGSKVVTLAGLIKLEALGKNFRRLGGKVDTEALQVLRAKTEELNRIRSRQDGLRGSVQNFIYFALLANFALAVLLVILFFQDIVKRIDLLVNSAKILAQRGKMTESVAGSDELHELDLVLHRVSANLEAADGERRAIMAMIAHDMRSPVMAAQTSIELLFATGGGGLNELSRGQLDGAGNNLNMVLRLVDDLLLMEKLQAGLPVLQLLRCDLRAIVEEAIGQVIYQADQSAIKVTNLCQSCLVDVDRRRIAQVLVVYLKNAIAASKADEPVEIRSESCSAGWKIVVADKSSGMVKGYDWRIFEKFFHPVIGELRTEIGLGLAISKLIVEAHGGQVGVDSQPGQGSDFWLVIPNPS